MASRFQRQILILGSTTAMGKLCAFLLDMQQSSAGNQPDMIVLPMSRYDIADYLAISVETVSRCLTALRARGAITLIRKREIRILDRGAFDNGLATAWDQGARTGPPTSGGASDFGPRRARRNKPALAAAKTEDRPST
jgi:hypothetical protein